LFERPADRPERDGHTQLTSQLGQRGVRLLMNQFSESMTVDLAAA
jgi:hypothetical protein